MRPARQLNISMLGKHVLEAIHHPGKLWVRLLSAKYLQDSHILQVDVPSGGSYTWKSILKAANLLKSGYIVWVGQGDVSLWYERWLHSGRLCNQVPFVDTHDIQLHVRELYQHRSWCFNNLYTQLPLNLKHEIQSVFLNEHTSDMIIWEPTTSGTYSAKSAYCWLMQHTNFSNDHNTTGWTWVWHLKLPENVKHFVWLMMQQGLPTNDLWVRRHVSL